MITLYTSATPNGWKASVALEELELPYQVHPLRLELLEHQAPWFVEINPNARIPAIVDHDEEDLAVFESGAILVYLAEKAGRLLPKEPRARAKVMSWLCFQIGGVGPMMGQANVFFRYLPEKIPLAIERYQKEGRRLFEVLDRRLGESEWLAEDYSIADIANWCWVRTHRWSGTPIDGLENLARWHAAMKARPACARGVKIPQAVGRVDADRDPAAAQAFIDRARKLL